MEYSPTSAPLCHSQSHQTRASGRRASNRQPSASPYSYYAVTHRRRIATSLGPNPPGLLQHPHPHFLHSTPSQGPGSR